MKVSPDCGYTDEVHELPLLPDPLTATAELVIAKITADARRVGAVRRALQSWLEATTFDPARIGDVALAVYEALANTVEHAYAGTCGTFTVRAGYMPTEHLLAVAVIDHGHWQSPTPKPLRGNGLRLATVLSDDVNIEHGAEGTTVLMKWTDLTATRSTQRHR